MANFTQFFLLFVTVIERLKTFFTVLVLNNVQRATIFGTTIVDAYAKPLLHYWLKTTYLYIYGKICLEFWWRWRRAPPSLG